MKRILCLAMVIILIGISHLAVLARSAPQIRVLLSKETRPVLFSSSRSFVVEHPGRSVSVPANGTATFVPAGNALLWKEENLTATQFTIKPSSQEYVYFGQRPYRGRFFLVPDSGSVRVINVLEIDDYVRGTMKLETNPAWPPAALKAQIIASRTFALNNLTRREDTSYDVCSTPLSQAYGGVNAEDSRTNRLIDQTRNLILTYQNEPANTVFHSQSGGMTEDAQNVWGRAVPYLIGVHSPWESDAPYASWEVRFSSEFLSSVLSQAGLSRGRIFDIQTIHTENAGRVSELVVQTDQGTFRISAQRFREAIGFESLPSTLFDLTGGNLTGSGNRTLREPVHSQTDWNRKGVDLGSITEQDLSLDDIIAIIEVRQRERSGTRSEALQEIRSEPDRELAGTDRADEFVFTGRGYGHGVGLSQWGARGMALAGYGYEEILLHYYPGCEIREVRFR